MKKTHKKLICPPPQLFSPAWPVGTFTIFVGTFGFVKNIKKSRLKINVNWISEHSSFKIVNTFNRSCWGMAKYRYTSPLSFPRSGIWAWGWQRSPCSWWHALTSTKSLIFLQKKDQDQWNYEIAKVPIIIETLKHVSTSTEVCFDI